MKNFSPIVFAAGFTAMQMPLVYYVVWKALNGPFSPEVQSMVIAAVVSGSLGSMAGFWLGTSASSARKTEIAEAKAPPAGP